MINFIRDSKILPVAIIFLVTTYILILIGWETLALMYGGIAIIMLGIMAIRPSVGEIWLSCYLAPDEISTIRRNISETGGGKTALICDVPVLPRVRHIALANQGFTCVMIKAVPTGVYSTRFEATADTREELVISCVLQEDAVNASLEKYGLITDRKSVKSTFKEGIWRHSCELTERIGKSFGEIFPSKS